MFILFSCSELMRVMIFAFNKLYLSEKNIWEGCFTPVTFSQLFIRMPHKPKYLMLEIKKIKRTKDIN